MDELIEGYRASARPRGPEQRALFERLAEHGQRPQAMVIACADSRADPGMIFNVGPGEIFVVRNVANLVPPCVPDGAYHGTSAALEFGVLRLGVSHLIVLGHGPCGGIRALLEGATARRPAISSAPGCALAEPARRRALACAPARSAAGLRAWRACGCRWRTC